MQAISGSAITALAALAVLGVAVAGPAAAQNAVAPPSDPKGAAEWHVDRGVYEYRSGRGNEAAIAEFTEAIRLDATHTSAWKLRGDRLFQLGRLDEALRDYDRAATLEPWDQTFEMRALLLERLGQLERAAADWDRAAELAPENGEYQNGRCWLRALADKDLDTARAACDRALELLPEYDSTGVLDSRALVSFRQGRFQDAWADYDKALAVVGGPDARYLYGRGVAALRMGRTADGQQDIQSAIELDATVANAFAELGLEP